MKHVKNRPTPHLHLASYIEKVVPKAYSIGRLESNYGFLARFGELIGAERATVWSWLYVNHGMPRNRMKQIEALNKLVGISLSEDELDRLFVPRSEKHTKPLRVLFEEVEKSARERNLQSSVVRKRIADFMGVTSRTLYRYEVDGDIPDRRKGPLREAITSLNINVPDEVLAKVFGH